MVPRRARIQGSYIFASLNFRLRQVINKYLHDHELGSINIDERRKSIEGSFSAERVFGRSALNPETSKLEERNDSWTCLVQTFGRAGTNLGRDLRPSINIDERRKSIEGSFSAERVFGRSTLNPDTPREYVQNYYTMPLPRDLPDNPETLSAVERNMNR